jgi:Co/Zn/Cd efflux system component
MELLGTIANIFIIWILILFVAYESTLRIINKEFVEDPMIMLITSVGGFFINLVMYKVLQNGAHHSCGLLSNSYGHKHMKYGHKDNK